MIGLKTIGIGKNLEITVESKDYNQIVRDLLTDQVVCKMKQYLHHYNTNCYQHSLNVSYYCYLICKRLHWDYRSAARAGMLHDLFLYDWTTHKKITGERFHAMTHPKVAYQNASRYFALNPVEKDIIVKHMWPLTVVLPKYKEAYIIILIDKYCGFLEILQHFVVRKKRTN